MTDSQERKVTQRNGKLDSGGNISRRDFISASAMAAGALALGGCGGTGESRRPPNFVFILADDLGWRDVGFMGSRYYETPSLDRFAGQGMVFTDAYANAPNCAPTRASILTGRYSPRHGILTVNSSERGRDYSRRLIPIENKLFLDPDEITVAELLRQAGYETAAIGKWHLGEGPETGPLGQGFELNIGGYRAGMPKSYFSPYWNPELSDGPDGEYLTERLTDEAVGYLNSRTGSPFFLYLSYHVVHTPIQPKPELVGKYRGKQPDGDQNNPDYAAMVEALDTGVGRVLAALDENGLADNTVVIFFSDNGGHRQFTDNSPLRGGKGTLYEGGIREPLVVRAPGVTTAGSSCSTPVIGVDFLPTMLELAAVNAPRAHLLDGESIVPLLGGGDIQREAIYWHFPVYLEDWGYPDVRDPGWRATPCSVIRCGRWKLIEYFEDWSVELFDLENDIGERNDLAGSHPDVRDRLRTMLQQWRKDIGARIPTERNPSYDPGRASQ
ncbi:MAG: sulfatase [Candidatus Glassbacteria bacterium]|nr:sulfatase [Candidatus Glassbacteria bacterium]